VAVARDTWKPGNQGNRADLLTPVYRSTGFPAYQIYFHSRSAFHEAFIHV